jgi:hypothetical protein
MPSVVGSEGDVDNMITAPTAPVISVQDTNTERLTVVEEAPFAMEALSIRGRWS